ncbi:MAG: phytoene/squalene synthase family protein [Halorhodospira sp.]
MARPLRLPPQGHERPVAMSEEALPAEMLHRAAPPGSSLDYALRLAPRSRRAALQAIAAYSAEIRRIPLEVNEPEVARAKVHWWRTELTRILDGYGNHPLATPLTTAIHEHKLPGADLRALLDEADRTLDGDRADTFHEQCKLAERYGAAPLRLAARVLTGEEADTYASTLGAAVTLTRTLRLQGLAARHGDSDLPREILEQAGVPARGGILQRDATPHPALLDALTKQAEALAPLYPRAARQAPQSRAAQRALHPLTAYGAIHQALLAELRRRPAEILRGRLTLQPLRKVWIAWRGRIRAP